MPCAFSLIGAVQASGDMAMHRAAEKGPPSAVEALLGAGAEVGPTNKV